jgi:hypothetical protein
MDVPTALWIVPTESLDEAEKLNHLLIGGWETPPSNGAQLLVVPSDPGQLTREIRWIYTVKSSAPNDSNEWPWELRVKGRAVATPRPWYDLVRESQVRGLVSLSGASGMGEEIVHRPTIEMIYEMLGEA